MNVVFFDIDGTLATGTHVPASAARALERIRAHGHAVFICTGRPLRYVRANFGAYADGFVCSNGRFAVRGDEVLVNKPIAKEQFEAIVDVLDEHNAGYAFFSKENLYYGGNPAYRHVAHEVNGPTRDLQEGLLENEDLYSFDIYFATPAERDSIAETLRGICLVNPHGPHPSADVTVLGYGKGDAALDVTHALGLDYEQSYAFGDGINDLSMIQAVAHGVAMGNAVGELKAAAEYVTTDIDDDGVENGLAHFRM